MAYNPRYCLEPLDVRRLKRMWNDNVQHDNDGWQCFDDFALWSSDMGYAKGMYMKKRNELMHHSPENSYYWAAGYQYHEQPEKPDDTNISPFCKGCEKNCVNSMGCADWQKWFAKNWNENISISKKLKQNVPVRMTWKYEHPDLIREGIAYGKA